MCMDKPIPQWLESNLKTTEQDRVYYTYPTVVCEGCSKPVVDRRINIYRTENLVNRPHTRYQCTICKKYKNPLSGEWDLTGVEITNLYRKLHSRDK